MSQSEARTARVFEHSVEIPAEASLQIWQAWCALSHWPDWDASLRGVIAAEDGLALGKGFAVVPKAAPAPIPVNVTALEEGRTSPPARSARWGCCPSAIRSAKPLAPHARR